MKTASVLFLLAGFANAANVTIVEEIVCKVSGEIITRTELEHDRRDAETNFRQQGLAGPRLQEAVNAYMRNALRTRIDTMLLIQKAKELDIKVDNELSKQLAAIQRRANIADPEKFQQFVHEQTGASFEDYKNDFKNQLLVTQVIRQEVTSKIQFKKEELLQYYNDHQDEFMRKEQIFLSQILVSTEGKDAAGLNAAEKKSKDLTARARKGEKFPEMAQTNSDDQATAQQGGYMGNFAKGELLPEIEAAVWEQPRGYISDPIKMRNGWAIFRVDEHQKAGLPSFDEVENEVTDKVFEPRRDPATRAFLNKLRTEAFLQIKPGYEDSGAVPGKDTSWNDPVQLRPQTVTKEEVAAKGHKKKLLGMVPLPGTNSTEPGTSSSK